MREVVVREYEKIPELEPREEAALRSLALEEQKDADGQYRRVFVARKGQLHAANYVGLVEVSRKTTLLILPKVDLADGDDEKHTGTRKAFLRMLRDWRGLHEAQFPEAAIGDLKRFEMWEAFYFLFLQSVVRLAQRGLARRYRTVENNLPFLRGRIRFPEHLRQNAVNRARFFVAYDEFSADRPANRLIRTALDWLAVRARRPRNQQLIHGLRVVFADIPPSSHPAVDWDRRLVDRSMRHYGEVLPWVGLLLFHHGLATFAGEHRNRALLFPMEEVFEDFVTASVRRHQEGYDMRSQGPMQPLAKTDGGKNVFYMMPDVTLMEGRTPKYILDAKWKRLEAAADDPKMGIAQSDLYQLFAYGKKYRVPTVALVYPRSEKFRAPVRYTLDDDLRLVCFPFDVTKPKESVGELLGSLRQGESAAAA